MKLKSSLVLVTSLALWVPQPGLGLQDTTGNSQKEQSKDKLAASTKEPAGSTVQPACPGTAEFPKRQAWERSCKPFSFLAVKKRCLYVSDMLVRGSVKDDDGNTVVIVSNKRNPDQHPAFLRQNDDLFNAKVEKTAPEAITFCEYPDTRTDRNPHEVTVTILAVPIQSAAKNDQSEPATGAGLRIPVSKSEALGGCTSGKYSGSKFDFHLNDVDVATFMRLLYETAGLNFILDSSVKGRVTLEATDMPWDQALVLALKNNGLECEFYDNLLRIVTLETLKKDVDQYRATQAATGPAEAIQADCLHGKRDGAQVILGALELEIGKLFSLAHDAGGLVVVVDPDIKGTVTLGMYKPWQQVLSAVIRNNGLRCDFDGKTLHISNLK